MVSSLEKIIVLLFVVFVLFELVAVMIPVSVCVTLRYGCHCGCMVSLLLYGCVSSCGGMLRSESEWASVPVCSGLFVALFVCCGAGLLVVSKLYLCVCNWSSDPFVRLLSVCMSWVVLAMMSDEDTVCIGKLLGSPVSVLAMHSLHACIAYTSTVAIVGL